MIFAWYSEYAIVQFFNVIYGNIFCSHTGHIDVYRNNERADEIDSCIHITSIGMSRNMNLVPHKASLLFSDTGLPQWFWILKRRP